VRYILLISSALTLAPGGSWADNIWTVHESAAELGFGQGQYSTFGLNNFQSLAPDFTGVSQDNLESLVMPSAAGSAAHHHYSLLKVAGDNNTLIVPLYRQQKGDHLKNEDQFQAWGVEWQHRLNAEHSFSLSAHMGENFYYENSDLELGETTSTMAAVSWTTRLNGGSQPSISGSFFFGDELTNPENEHQFARKYYGFSIGGQITVADKHTPYLSFRLQKSNYIFDDTLNWEGVDENFYSKLSAGWSWQVQDNWSLKAEANYSLSDVEMDWRYDRSKLFFGTRYDFR